MLVPFDYRKERAKVRNREMLNRMLDWKGKIISQKWNSFKIRDVEVRKERMEGIPRSHSTKKRGIVEWYKFG